MSDESGSPLRLAVAGMGLRGVGMAGMILSGFPDVRIVALADRIAARAALARDYLGLSVPCFDDVERCLDETAPEALAVFTPDVQHEAPAVAALRRGLHVYCEKPMSTTLGACDRMIAAAQSSRGVFYMGHNMRMSPFHNTIRQVVASGELGEVLTIQTSEYYYGGRSYFRRWNRLLAVGGGLWVTKSVHDFDMMCWLAGREPVSIYAAGGRKVFQPRSGAAARCRDCDLRWDCEDYQPPETVGVGELAGGDRQLRFWEQWQRLGQDDGYLPADACLYRGDIETIEYGCAVVRFDGGACATHTLSVVTTPQQSGRWIAVQGTRGCLRGDDLTDTIHVSFRSGKAPRTYDAGPLARGGHGGADRRIFRSFIRACRGQETPIADAADGRRAVMLGLAANRSMDAGQVVQLPC